MFGFLRKGSRRRKPIQKRRPKAHSFRPTLEALEDRCVPALIGGTPFTDTDFDGNTVLHITDNNAGTLIELEDDGDCVDVDVNGSDVDEFCGVDIVEIRLNGGNDTLDIDFTDAWDGDDDEQRTYLIKTGSGNDKVDVDADSYDVQDSGRADFEIKDGGGNDTYIFRFDVIENASTVNITTRAGDGKDNFSIILENDLTAGSLNLDVDMGTGDDQFSFNQTNDAPVSTFLIKVDLLMGSGADTATAFFGEDYDSVGVPQAGVMNFDAHLGDGNDKFTATFDTDQFDINEDNDQVAGSFFLSVSGEKGDDKITATRTTSDTPNSSDIEINQGGLVIDFDGGTGKDTIIVDFGTGSPGTFKGSGGFFLTIDGGGDNDVITVEMSHDDVSDLTFDIKVLGNIGNDKIRFTFVDFGSAIFIGGSPLVDGGLGTDLRGPIGITNVPVDYRNFEGEIP